MSPVRNIVRGNMIIVYKKTMGISNGVNQQTVIKENLINYLAVNLDRAGTPIIFLHGWRSDKEAWQGMVGLFQQENHPIFAMDLPGFGLSSAPKQAYTVENYAEIVLGFIRRQNLKQVILVGHSFGGRIGIKIAAQHQEFVEKLILVDSAGFAMESTKKNFYNRVAKLLRPVFKVSFMQGLRKKAYQAIGAEDYLVTPGLQKTFVNAVSEDLSEDMKKITCPTLLVFGSEDKDTPVRSGQRMQKLIPNSKLEILANAGHFSFLDKPGEFLELLKKFINA